VRLSDQSDAATGALSDRERHLGFALLFLSLISDGFDLQTMGFLAPGIARDWGVTRLALAPALSAGLVGVALGAPLLGWLGDRFGRKRAILIGSVGYGCLSLLCALAQDITQLTLLRFVTGIGLGGVLPNVIALTADVAKARLRRLLTALVSVGISLGGVLVGLVAAAILPHHGWRTLLVIGGLVPLAISGALALGLREPPVLPPQRDAPAHQPATPSAGLFSGDFRLLTPVIWLLFIGLLMSIYLLTSWLPLVLENEGLSPGSAAIMNTMLHLGGVVGGVIAAMLISRIGLPLITILIGGAWLLALLLAVAPVGDVALAAMLGLCGICLIGGQTAINAASGLIYPPAIRARGVGLALGVGRIGSMSGPIAGAAAMSLGPRGLFIGPLIPLGLSFIAATILARRGSIDTPAPIEGSSPPSH